MVKANKYWRRKWGLRNWSRLEERQQSQKDREGGKAKEGWWFHMSNHRGKRDDPGDLVDLTQSLDIPHMGRVDLIACLHIKWRLDICLLACWSVLREISYINI